MVITCDFFSSIYQINLRKFEDYQCVRQTLLSAFDEA